jgi:selenophosphate synthetase-related protein
LENREKHQWKTRYYEAENLIMTLDGKDEQKTHEVLTLKKELAKVRKEIEEKEKLLMRDSKRARGGRDFYARYCSYESESEFEDDPSTSYA